jgi:transposase-like protein
MNQTTSTVSQADQPRPGKPDTATRWRKLLEDQRASGLPISAFCRERGIAASSLFAWRRKLTRGGEERGGQEAFSPVVIATEGKPRLRRRGDGGDGGAMELAAASFIELCLRGERRLMVRRGFDRRLLGEVIAALEALP